MMSIVYFPFFNRSPLLTAGALLAINNGDFSTTADWNTAGATNIINGSATLTEQSQKLSELTQAFIIPTGAKTLQFTIKDNHLVTGDTAKTANDAFEVALLDTNTYNPLAGTSIGLNHTDSLLNIQANGPIHKSDKVTITALTNNSSIVTIDLTQITPSTQATLYFNLLGFGARTSTVTIDDVKLFTDTQPIPVTKNDTLVTNQNTPLTLDPTQLTTNDTNVTQIQIINQPTHGTLTQTPDGKLTYTPISTYIGNDSFTYLGFGTDGQISNLATVNLTVNNLPPTIETLTIPNQINEGQNIQLSATAKDGGTSDNLTYTWDLGDGSQPVIGQNITHQFVDNGTYNVVLTVTDKDGGSTEQTTQIKVDNLAPAATITTPNTTLNQGESLNLGVNYSDPGIKDTHTITWNFGDDSNPVTLTPLGFAAQPNLQSHTFTKAGNHNVTVTVTDNDGASTTETIQVTVTNLAPTITNVNIPTNINEGSTVQLTATASDAGNDTLTYNWYINGATTPIIGQTIDYNFANSGSYPVKLDVIDSNGAITTQTVDVAIANLAPTINSITIPSNIQEGETIQLQATASDAGNDAIIYNWYINGVTTPIIGQTIDYKFPNNGIYPVRLDVIDSDGAITTQTIDVTVKNVAPTIDNITIPTNIKEGETVQLTATASDSGNDTLTYNWYLNNATTPITGQSIDYIFTDNGTYPVKLEVIDTDGAVTTQTVDVTVTNIAPTIVNIVKPTTINEGESVTFSATVTDPGILDTLTYSWNFGDNTNPIIGQNVNHTFADNGTYSVVLTVTDKDGGVTTQTVVVKVDNVAPVVVSISKPNTIKEGELITFSATATDAGINDTLTYSWNFGDNTNPVLGQNVNHIFADNGNYNVTLTVTDRDGGVITESVAVTVDNVAPTIVNIIKPTIIKEGESAIFAATANDPGILDTLTYVWNFGDNTTAVSGQNVNHTFADNGNYNVTLTVTDKDGGVTTQTVVAKVDNVAPTIVSIAKPTTIKEGESVTFSATVTDPGILDTLTYSWNFGDNTTLVTGQNVNHIFADNGNYNVVLTVTDKDGAITQQSISITVDNVVPVVVSIVKPNTIKEGESVTFAATANDTGILDTLTYSWNFGDNTTPVSGQNVNHTFVDNGNYNVVLTVTDKDGGVTTQTVVVKVDNVAPTIVSIVKPDTIKEGESVTFTATTTDPGILDTLTYSWNFGDNTNPVTGQNVNHTFTDNGNYNVVLTVTDKDGAVTTQTVTVSVDNVTPIVVSIAKPTTIKEGESITFTATATDPGILDTLTYSWNFGDNTNPVSGQNATHTFADNGNYNLILTVTDKDGATTTQTLTVTVANVAPTITNITLPQNVVAGTAAAFTATATDVGTLDTLTYTWNFGDNTTPTIGQNSTHTFTTAGTYSIILTITDKDGAITTQIQSLTVTAPPSTGGSGIRAGGDITINGSANFDGNTTNRTDDTQIYAGKSLKLNGNITLPVKRDAAGNPIKLNGKIVLVDNQITLGTGATTSSNPNQYTNITTATQTITIPTYADIKLQEFTPPIGAVIKTFNIQTTPIRNSADWNTKFPPAGTATNPTVVRIINGNLDLPANINLSNYILIVENGNINFSQGNPVLNNVKLIANNGNINLNSTTGTNLSLSASGNINITGNTKLGGTSIINSNGNITTNGGLSMVNTTATVKMIAQGDLNVNGNTSLKGQLFAKKNVTINGQTTLVGSIDALLNVSIGGNTTILVK